MFCKKLECCCFSQRSASWLVTPHISNLHLFPMFKVPSVDSNTCVIKGVPQQTRKLWIDIVSLYWNIDHKYSSPSCLSLLFSYPPLHVRKSSIDTVPLYWLEILFTFLENTCFCLILRPVVTLIYTRKLHKRTSLKWLLVLFNSQRILVFVWFWDICGSVM